MEGYRRLKELIEPIYPGLLDAIQDKIARDEKDYEKGKEREQDSFLWEHSLFVGVLALKICRLENRDPLLPVVAGLVHDIGKFEGGQYHKNSTPEETTTAGIAKEILTSFDLNKPEVDLIVSGLLALYDEDKQNNFIADIVHDADFLSKTGYLGVANFFIKSAKRGLNLYASLSRNLSKELTYASVLPKNMRTSGGKKLAEKKSQDLRLFFNGLLQELRESDIAKFEVREEILPCPQGTGEDIKFILVLPESCPTCSEEMNPEYSFVQGIKCTELAVLLSCVNCPTTIPMSFCLPEIIG